MFPEAAVVPFITFLLGLLVGLLYKDMRFASSLATIKQQIGHTNLSTLETEINNLKTLLCSTEIVSLSANVKSMKENILFTPDFQKALNKIFAEHDILMAKVKETENRINESMKYKG